MRPSSHDSATTQAAESQDALTPFAQALREHFPSKEALLHQARQQVQRRRKIKKAIAGTTLTATMALTWVLDPVLYEQDLHTAIGDHSQQRLADDTWVTLNTNTVLHVEYRLRSRQVQLKQGEALFNVKHGWRPFTVLAGQACIRDIGTIFNVRQLGDDIAVTVLEGAVKVSTAGHAQILHTNQAIMVNQHQLSPVQTVEAEHTVAWQHGKLMFDGTPLYHVIADIQRYHPSPIKLADKTAGQFRMSGEYDIAGIPALLEALPQIANVSVAKQADGTIIIRSK